jgi:hypothetical protein
VGIKKILPQARTEEILFQTLKDETLIYDLKRHKAHCLNRTAALIWNNCDGRTTVAEMAESLSRELNEPVDEEVVWLALNQLSNAKLIEDKATGMDNAPRLSRRELVRKIGVGAAITLPLITSVLAPEAAQAVSCIPEGGVCDDKASCCPGLNCTANMGFKRCTKPGN